MKTEDGINYIVLAQYGVPYVTPESVTVMADCNHPAWASPAAMAKRAEDPEHTKMICMLCYLAAEDVDGKHEMRPLDGAVESVGAAFGLNATDAQAEVEATMEKMRGMREAYQKGSER